jgi:hypothetical protein
MDNISKAELEAKILQVIRDLQAEPSEWVNFAKIGGPLAATGVQYKDYGFLKLRPFLNEFSTTLEFEIKQAEGTTPTCYVRPRSEPLTEDEATTESDGEDTPFFAPQSHGESNKVPAADTWLFRWAMITPAQIERLAELALPEKWYYGDEEPADRFPILKNYLGYTFKKLCTENKVCIETDLERGEEYAAFNTGLVDQKYEYIYALCKQNTRSYGPYWYLVDFVVAGEDAGKTLVNLFNPMPCKADYFKGRIENMLYDTSTGNLSCDYVHILAERTHRLPVSFFQENCPAGFTCIDDVDIADVAELDDYAPEKKEYFRKLGEKIQHTPKILNRLKNRLDDAVKLALKRVEWNYKTAIPVYFPSRDAMSLLLPLALVDEDQIDLALVVERKQSGAYQGQTVLPLAMAYSNSRLVTRPDSDWLKTDIIATVSAGSQEE